MISGKGCCFNHSMLSATLVSWAKISIPGSAYSKASIRFSEAGNSSSMISTFIFNSLNTLSYLIGKNQQDARLYTDTLARVYRYILSSKERDLVFLKEEIEFMSNYFYLLKIRFSHSITMEIEMADLDTDNFLITPISLQILIENAVKHNEFSELKKLFISAKQIAR